jgi:hypothetical protein
MLAMKSMICDPLPSYAEDNHHNDRVEYHGFKVSTENLFLPVSENQKENPTLDSQVT